MEPKEGSSREDEPERAKFNEASEQEQIERFNALNNLFADKKANPRGNYGDFFENVYKYTDRFKMEGLDKNKLQLVFNNAKYGNETVKAALGYFLEVKKIRQVLEIKMT